ncbi:MAG: hypothetical protein KIT56_10405 [Gammaproteobacteria bacterium]|nr:hypothetical protein [Gammaproteobacteria bacterium]MCW5584261.1 hypothetical protein [Gammaproteobacteria bacterium]
MKYIVTRFKSFKVCIKELEPFIRHGEHLQTGKPFKRFGNLRSREILGNWLLCTVINFEYQFNRVTLCSDPQGADGIIYDSTSKKAWQTEHILVPRNDSKEQDIVSLIVNSIEKKQSKGGAPYASGKTLVVFINANGGEWYPNRVARQLPTTLYFEGVWIIGLQRVIQERYIYNVTRLNVYSCPIWQVRIEKDFNAWKVKRIQ